MWKIIGKSGEATDNIIRHMRFAYVITKASDTHSKYVTIIAFPKQKLLREHVSMLRYTYVAYNVIK